MGAAGFGSLAQHFTDRTVVTYDPRGSERSKQKKKAAELGDVTEGEGPLSAGVVRGANRPRLTGGEG
jgi:hypothetical protein